MVVGINKGLSLRIIFTVILLLLLISCGTLSVKDSSGKTRQIAYIEQENPGALIMLTLTSSGHVVGGSILDANAGMRDNRFAVSGARFAYIWDLITSAELADFNFTPKKTDSMSDPKYYTIVKKSGSGEINYRVPVESELPRVKELIGAFKTIIEENR